MTPIRWVLDRLVEEPCARCGHGVPRAECGRDEDGDPVHEGGCPGAPISGEPGAFCHRLDERCSPERGECHCDESAR